MNFYDFYVNPEFSEGESSLDEIVRRAKILNYKGVCIVNHFKSKNVMESLKKKISELSKKLEFEIFLGFEAKTVNELKKLVSIRREYDVLLVSGSDLYLNRKAVETKKVDILTHPELDRKDSGLNQVMAKLATKNNVAIGINFREIIQSSKKTRSNIMHNMEKNVKLCKKYKTPIIICSGAVSHWQLKDPKILISIGHLLGLELKEAKKALSEVPKNIIRMIRERQDKKWVRPGVKVVK